MVEKWEKLLPYKGSIHQGCLNCPAVEHLASLEMVIGVGFGIAEVKKGNRLIFSEGRDIRYSFYSSRLAQLLIYLLARGCKRYDGLPLLADIEELARHDPDHDWRIMLDAPLRGREYQRHGDGTWVLVGSTRGFA